MWTAVQKANANNVSELTDEEKEIHESHPATRNRYTYKEVKKVEPIKTLAKTKKKSPDNQGKG